MNYLHPASISDNREQEEAERERGIIVALMKDLNNKFNNLPKGKPDPKSSHVEHLYARKEESVLKLKNRLNNLSHCRKAINDIVQKHKQKLEILGQDKKELNTKQAKTNYSFAEFIQENIYRHALSCKEELDRIIGSASQAINLANTKKFPGKKPQKQPPILIPKKESLPQPAFEIPPVIPDMSISQPPPLLPPIGGQVNSLLSLGPIGK